MYAYLLQSRPRYTPEAIVLSQHVACKLSEDVCRRLGVTTTRELVAVPIRKYQS
jgi:hypothetical protein